MIVIVDYGMGNVGSIQNMLKKAGAKSEITSNHAAIQAASKLILPGVGAFDAGMKRLTESGLIPILNEQVLEKKVPVLGICLGMQLMTRGSEEGKLAGLGWVAADTVRFTPSADSNLKVPHMGWNLVTSCRPSSLLKEAEAEERFYFVHSYFVRCDDPNQVLLRCEYGHWFDAAFQSGNVTGVQFHPEKSHKFGLRLLRNFVEGY